MGGENKGKSTRRTAFAHFWRKALRVLIASKDSRESAEARSGPAVWNKTDSTAGEGADQEGGAEHHLVLDGEPAKIRRELSPEGANDRGACERGEAEQRRP